METIFLSLRGKMKRSNIDLFIPTYTRSGTCDLPQTEDMSKIEKYATKTGGCCGPKMTLRANKVNLFPLYWWNKTTDIYSYI